MERSSSSFSISASTDVDRSQTDLSQIRVHRLLSFLGAALSLYLGSLYAANNPEAFIPSGTVGVVVAVLFAALLAASYGSTVVRQQCTVGMRAVLYVVLVWGTAEATLNGVAGVHGVGLLLAYAVLSGMVGLSARSRGPVLRFLGTGLLLAGAGLAVGPMPHIDALTLMAGMGLVALAEGLAIERLLSVRRTHREQERRSRKTEDFFGQVLDRLPVDLAVFDPEARLEYVNPHGVSTPEMREVLVGKTNEEYYRRQGLDPEIGRQRDEAIRTVVNTKETSRVQETVETPDGAYHYTRIYYPVTDHEGRVTHVVRCSVNATHRDRSEHEPRTTEAQETPRLTSIMLENMSHEIRTPLTSIIGFAEAIGAEAKSIEACMETSAPDTIRRFADRVEKSGRRLLETLDRLLNFSKLDADETTLSEEPVELGAVAEKIAEQFEPQARENDLGLRVETGDTPIWARANTEGTRIALRNLVSNAIKYTPEGGEVHVRTWLANGTAVLEVEDTGIGMDPKQVPELFEAFRQASEGRSRTYEGTGLGLTVAREAVEQMSGSIEVETEKDRGSRFIVRLPRWVAEATPIPGQTVGSARERVAVQ